MWDILWLYCPSAFVLDWNIRVHCLNLCQNSSCNRLSDGILQIYQICSNPTRTLAQHFIHLCTLLFCSAGLCHSYWHYKTTCFYTQITGLHVHIDFRHNVYQQFTKTIRFRDSFYPQAIRLLLTLCTRRTPLYSNTIAYTYNNYYCYKVYDDKHLETMIHSFIHDPLTWLFESFSFIKDTIHNI